MRKIFSSKPTIGAWSTVGNVLVTEAMLSTGGFDWLAIDLEHCPYSEKEIIDTFLMCEKWNVFPFARLSGHDQTQTKKMLDFGAKGVLVPYIETVEEVQNITRVLEFGPHGRRGVCLARINQWGDQFGEYINQERPIFVAQIESKKGLENLAEIAQVESVDGLFLGPYDLSASLGTPGEFGTAEFIDALVFFKETCKENGKWAGIHVVDPEVQDLRMKVEEGFNFLAYGTDLICLRHSLKSMVAQKGKTL